MTQTGQRDDRICFRAAEIHVERPCSVQHFAARRGQSQHDLAKSNDVRHILSLPNTPASLPRFVQANALAARTPFRVIAGFLRAVPVAGPSAPNANKR